LDSLEHRVLRTTSVSASVERGPANGGALGFDDLGSAEMSGSIVGMDLARGTRRFGQFGSRCARGRSVGAGLVRRLANIQMEPTRRSSWAIVLRRRAAHLDR